MVKFLNYGERGWLSARKSILEPPPPLTYNISSQSRTASKQIERATQKQYFNVLHYRNLPFEFLVTKIYSAIGPIDLRNLPFENLVFLICKSLSVCSVSSLVEIEIGPVVLEKMKENVKSLQTRASENDRQKKPTRAFSSGEVKRIKFLFSCHSKFVDKIRLV